MPALVPAAMSSSSPPPDTRVTLSEIRVRYPGAVSAGSIAVPSRLAAVAAMNSSPAAIPVFRFESIRNFTPLIQLGLATQVYNVHSCVSIGVRRTLVKRKPV